MKTLAFIALCLTMLCNQTAEAQITLDHIYTGGMTRLYMVNLEYSGFKYVVKSDYGNRFLKFYNVDHSIWKTIDCNGFPVLVGDFGDTSTQYDALYISEAIFDCDSAVEFLYSVQQGYNWFTAIYKEDGTALLIADSCYPAVKINVPQQYRPMYNTPTGTKLILSHLNGNALVYNVPCGLTTAIDQLTLQPADPAGLNIYPNPAFYKTTIDYTLPANVQQGEIVLHDLNGREIKRYKVDNSFSSLYIELKDLQAGTYIYSLVAQGNILISKKINLIR